MVFTMALESDEARVAVEAAQSAGGRLLLVPHIEGRYASVGVIAEVMEEGTLPGGLQAVAVRGDQRATIGTAVPGTGDALWVEAEPLDEGEPTPAVGELAREYRAVLENILLSRGARQVATQLREVTEPGRIADVAGYSPDLNLAQKVQILETVDVEARLRLVLGWARETLADLTLRERIKTDVEEGMEKTQREFLLRRQLESIRKELGQINPSDEDAPDDYRTAIEGRDLPEDVRKAVEREISKLERTNEQSPEQGWIRTWLDTVLELPWGKLSEDRLDVSAASQILDEDHDGLSDVKERILEHLSVRKLQAERGLAPVGGRGNGAILALVGPPGVGKTSVGESVARALNRSFVRVALGGVRDEAEIRGHRRTYVGAQPGRLVRALREAGTMNPVILLDEVDKLGADYRGDPSSALLEVLDPAQNHTFRDHYLEVELDLSKVLFIATANMAEAIPDPLLDRMEVVSLDGYTEDEKVTIAAGHLLPRQLERAGLDASDVTVTHGALRRLSSEYTREAGVRALERAIARILRKIAAQLAAGRAELPVTVGPDDLHGYLGHPRHTPESADRTAVPGVATGLAVTGAGGDVLFIEASLADAETGSTGVTLTGQLGEVMKESAQIALSYLRSHGAELELPVGDLKDRGVHVHVPAGAVPKDGPSAGITMTTALASLLSGRLVRSDVAMTGEVSLTGRVLPIGGLKQKLLAAQRAGITTVLIPKRNEPDLEDVPEKVRSALTVLPVTDVREVLAAALAPATAQAAIAA